MTRLRLGGVTLMVLALAVLTAPVPAEEQYDERSGAQEKKKKIHQLLYSVWRDVRRFYQSPSAARRQERYR